jgi:hypothetical protein
MTGTTMTATEPAVTGVPDFPMPLSGISQATTALAEGQIRGRAIVQFER